MDLVSVVVPVYNVEKYLNRCVESIVNQTYKNLEIILVDDGSLDNCPVMCDEWAKKDNRIKVIHKKNGGVSSARNAGIDKSNGKYISFIDPDDYIEENMYFLMIKKFISQNLDICCCNFKEVDENDSVLSETNFNNDPLLGRNILADYIRNGQYNPSCCNKLYVLEIIKKNKILFEVNTSIGEDFLFNYHYFKYCKKSGCIKETAYSYMVKRSDSLTKKIDEKRVERWNNTKKIMEYEKNDDYMYRLCLSKLINELFSCLKEIIDNGKLKILKSSYREIISCLKTLYSDASDYNILNSALKMNYRLVLINPWLYILAHKFRKAIKK